MARIYVETSIASFYYEVRTEPIWWLVANGRDVGMTPL